MKLNVGAGTDIRYSPWVNLDIRQLQGIDVVSDARSLPFEDNSAEELLAQDVIEHLPFANVSPTLQEWWRVLEPGGRLSIRTPDFLKIFRATITRRLDDPEAFRLVFGDESPEAGGYEWGGHKSGYSKTEWTSLLRALTPSPEEILIEEHETEFNLYIIVTKPK